MDKTDPQLDLLTYDPKMDTQNDYPYTQNKATYRNPFRRSLVDALVWLNSWITSQLGRCTVIIVAPIEICCHWDLIATMYGYHTFILLSWKPDSSTRLQHYRGGVAPASEFREQVHGLSPPDLPKALFIVPPERDVTDIIEKDKDKFYQILDQEKYLESGAVYNSVGTLTPSGVPSPPQRWWSNANIAFYTPGRSYWKETDISFYNGEILHSVFTTMYSRSCRMILNGNNFKTNYNIKVFEGQCLYWTTKIRLGEYEFLFPYSSSQTSQWRSTPIDTSILYLCLKDFLLLQGLFVIDGSVSITRLINCLEKDLHINPDTPTTLVYM